MSDARLIWELKNIRLRSRDQKIYELPDLSVEQGQRVALVGENRELRRAIFRLLAGLEAPHEGTCSFEGKIILNREQRHLWMDHIPHSTRRKMGVSLERDGLLSNVSLRESMETFFRFKYGDHNSRLREGAVKAAQESSDIMGLSEEALSKRPSDLTLLERRLASLALAFMAKPSILLLENPALGLGDEAWTVLSQVLSSLLKGSKKTFLVDTDDWLLARDHADFWWVCDASGKVESLAKEDFLKQRPEEFIKIVNSEKSKAWREWFSEFERGAA